MNLAASQTGTSKADGKTTIPDKNVYIYLNSLKKIAITCGFTNSR